jgi:predicted TIM-barrel fold metal-dependent hydrolase
VTGPTTSPRLFDVHAHLISDDPLKYPYAPLGGVVDESVLEDPMTAERLLGEMRANGVERAVAVQRAHVYGTDNKYVVDAASANPGAFVSLVLVNPLADDGAAAARHWISECGAVGVRLTAPSMDNRRLDWLTSPEAHAVWDAVSDLGATMRLHFYDWNREAGLAETAVLARRYPSTPIVLDHLSNAAATPEGPDYGVDDALKRLSECPNMSIMFSTINVTKSSAAAVELAPLVARVCDIFGAERMMWGSDVGQSKPTYSEMVAMAVAAVTLVPASSQRGILWETASRIYAKP